MGTHSGIALGSPERWDAPAENKVETKESVQNLRRNRDRERRAGAQRSAYLLTEMRWRAPPREKSENKTKFTCFEGRFCMDSTTKLQEGEGRGRPPWWEEGERVTLTLGIFTGRFAASPTLGMTNLG